MAGLGRWWTYQRERFPLLVNGPLIAVFSLSAVSYSALLRGASAPPSAAVGLTAFLTCLLFFLQLRLADEHKDAEDDLVHRPYRPVPRGLVTLRELTWLGLGAAAVQVGLALWLEPRLLWLLALVWGYGALMTKEFFAPAWLKTRPLMVLWTHMLIMPLIDLYATACDWLVVAGSKPSAALAWFLLISFFNGVVIEVGRKLRAPADEEEGVETYSALYGINRALWLWLGALASTAVAALFAAYSIDFLVPVIILLALLFSAALLTAWRFQRSPKPGGGKAFEIVSGLWTLGLYLSVGVVPLLWHMWS